MTDEHDSSSGSAAAEPAQDRASQVTDALQRVTAEYANYRKRADRDQRDAAAQARAAVVSNLLPALDVLDRAAEHGDLTGPLRAVSDTLNEALAEAGLQRFGEDGEVFDPAVHAAVEHHHSSAVEVLEPTVTRVHRHGYRLGDQVLRPALVAVTEPDPEIVEAEPDPPVSGADETATGLDSDRSGGEVS